MRHREGAFEGDTAAITRARYIKPRVAPAADELECSVTIMCDRGLHLRTTRQLIDFCRPLRDEITLAIDDEQVTITPLGRVEDPARIDGSVFLAVLMLCVRQDDELTVRARGPTARSSLAAIARFIPTLI